MYWLTDSLGVTHDNYNWILIQNPKRDRDRNSWRGKHSYYSDFRSLSRAVVDLKLKEVVVNIKHTDVLLTEIERELQSFLEKTITK